MHENATVDWNYYCNLLLNVIYLSTYNLFITKLKQFFEIGCIKIKYIIKHSGY